MGSDRTNTSATRPGALGAVIIVMVLAAGAYWMFTNGPGRQLLSPPGSTVASFSGDRPQTTPSFSVRAGWGIHWESTGPFSFAIRGDRDFGTVISTDGPGSGITSPTGEGTYFLEVDAAGPWTITISQGD